MKCWYFGEWALYGIKPVPTKPYVRQYWWPSINLVNLLEVKQPKLTAIIQSRRLTQFGHIMRMDDNADAKRILLASPPADWRRQVGRPRITWLSTVQLDLRQHHHTLPEAADLAQNHPLWRIMSTYGATQSWVACQKRRRRLEVCRTRWIFGMTQPVHQLYC